MWHYDGRQVLTVDKRVLPYFLETVIENDLCYTMVAAEQVLAYYPNIRGKGYGGWKNLTGFFDFIKQSSCVYEKTQTITSYNNLL